MKRKLVKQGTSTLMISLPSKWIKQHHLEKGSEITVEPLQNDILISASEGQRKAQITIQLSGLTESFIRTLVTNTYRQGFDIITVAFENEKQFRILNAVIQAQLIGFEVIKKDAKSCLIENITEPAPEQFDNILCKIFMNIDALFELVQKRLQKDAREYRSEYEEIEERIKKYDNFCRRVIVKQRKDQNELLWTFLTLIIHGQRELYHLNKSLDQQQMTDKQNLIRPVQQLFKHIEQGYLNKDLQVLERIHDEEKEIIYREGYKQLQEHQNANNIVTYHLLAATRNFYLASSPLVGLLLTSKSS